MFLSKKSLFSKLFAFFTLFFIALAPVNAQVMGFGDVSQNDWFAQTVEWAADESLIDLSKDNFNPHDSMIRADVSVVLFRFLNPAGYQDVSVFSDVPENQYYTEPVNALARDGIVTGYLDKNDLPTGNFGTTDFLTRAQAAILMDRINPGEFDDFFETPPFSDLRTSHYGYTAMGNLYGAEVMQGYTDGTGRPDAPVTRAEFLELLRKATEFNGFENPVDPVDPTDPVDPVNPDPTNPTDPTDPVDPDATYEAMENELITFDAGGFDLTAYVTRPEGPATPAVVIMHGCGGAVKDNEDPFAEMELESQYRDIGPSFAAQGYTAVVVDSLTGRRQAGLMDADMSEICGTSGEVLAEFDRQEDGLVMFDYLQSQDYVVKDEIFVMGFSHGGSTVLHLLHNEKQRYAAGVAVYPGCGLYGAYKDSWNPKAPFEMYVASDDTSTPPDPRCYDRIDEAKALGADVKITTFEGATHSYYPKKDDSQANMDAFLGTEQGVFDFFAQYVK